QPNYTVNTLAHLEERYPDYSFALIMGEDNLNSLHKWKNYEVILANHEVFVYPRIADNQKEVKLLDHPKITQVKAPIMQVSSSFSRKDVKQKKNIRPLVPPKVWTYMDEMNFYRETKDGITDNTKV